MAPPKTGPRAIRPSGFILARLKEAGIGEAAILDLCTYADAERFYSFRRTTHRGEPDYGRLISAISWRNERVPPKSGGATTCRGYERKKSVAAIEP